MKNPSDSYLESQPLSRTGLFLLILLDLLIILGIFLLDYKFGLIVLITIPFLLLSFSDLRIALWLLIAFSTLVVFYRGLVSAVMMVTLSSILIFVFLAAYLKFCIRPWEIKKTYLNLPVAVFMAIVFFQALRGIFSSYPLKWLGTELLAYLGFGMFFLVINLCDKKETIRKFFQLMIVVAYYQVIVGIWNYFFVGHRIGGYLFGTFPSLIALVLLNLSFYSKERSKKLTYLLLSLPPLLHLLFSFTRGYWLGFIGALVFSYGIYLLNSDYSLSRKFLKFAKGTVTFTLLVLILGSSLHGFLIGGNFASLVARRLTSSFSTKLSPETASNFERLIEYEACWERIKEKPILGYGIGYIHSFTDPFLRQRIHRWAVHQFYLMVTLKMGLIGLLAFLWIFYVFFREGLRKSRNIQSGYYRGLSFGFLANSVQLLIISLTNHEFASVVNTFYLAFTLGGVVIINAQNDQISKEINS